jgi:hypothetical protein
VLEAGKDKLGAVCSPDFREGRLVKAREMQVSDLIYEELIDAILDGLLDLAGTQDAQRTLYTLNEESPSYTPGLGPSSAPIENLVALGIE